LCPRLAEAIRVRTKPDPQAASPDGGGVHTGSGCLAGIGGLTSFATSWMTRQAQAKAQRVASERDKREALFGGFLEEAAKLYADALQNKRDDASALIGIYARANRIRPLSSARVVESADTVTRVITHGCVKTWVPGLSLGKRLRRRPLFRESLPAAMLSGSSQGVGNRSASRPFVAANGYQTEVISTHFRGLAGGHFAFQAVYPGLVGAIGNRHQLGVCIASSHCAEPDA
jgi:hypothetical protein